MEGCDGSGKSTLARRLHDAHGYEVVKTGPPVLSEDVASSYLSVLIAALRWPGHAVFDRHYLGELIYGPLLRAQCGLGVGARDAIEYIIERSDAQLVICSPPWETLIAGWRSKEDLLKDEVQVRHVYDRYLEEAMRLGIMPYDWTAPDAEERLKEMIEG